RLGVADADDQWTLETRADEFVRVVAMDDDEREVAVELAIGAPNRLDEISGVVAFDEVRDDLGVRLRAEDMAVSLQRALELAEVLDDPVQHDGDLLVDATGQRVGVLLG